MIDVHTIITYVIGIITGIVVGIYRDHISHYMNKRRIKKILKVELKNFVRANEFTDMYEDKGQFNGIASQIKKAVDIDLTCLTDYDIKTAYEVAIETEEMLNFDLENNKIVEYMAYATVKQDELTERAKYCLKRLNQNIYNRLTHAYPPRDSSYYRRPIRPPRTL